MTDQPPPVVYVVCHSEHETNAAVAAFTTPELAHEYTAELRKTGYFETLQLPVLDAAPKRVEEFRHFGLVNHETGRVEQERSWTMRLWDYEMADGPDVSIGHEYIGKTRIYVTEASSAEAAEAAFREAVEKVREA